ncbi:MAG TPA: hypothetical protein VGB82_19655 [Alphaproteobacteria bacterium]
MPFGAREFQQAGRNAQSAARNAQQAASEFMSGTLFEPYSELWGEVESATRQWADGMRTSLEQTLNVASKVNETFINEARRTSDFYLRFWETGASLQRSMMGNAGSWARQSTPGHRAQAAE